MKTIPLTQGQVALVDDEDYEYLMQWKWCAAWNGNTYYAFRGGKKEHGKKRQMIKMHRDLLDTPRGLEVDHLNGNGLDNRRCNIRNCTHKENMQNQHNRTANRNLPHLVSDEEFFAGFGEFFENYGNS